MSQKTASEPTQVFYSTPNSEEYYFDEGCYILEVLNDPTHGELSIARARVLPNTETKLHKLNQITEHYLIISGTGTAIINDESFQVAENDVLIIGENMPQKIINTGTEDLVFYAICHPRFTEGAYSECE